MRGGAGGEAIILALVVATGFLSVPLAIALGYADASSLWTYMPWAAMALAALLALFVFGTRSRADDVAAGFILLLTLGGCASAFLVHQGYVTAGLAAMAGLGILAAIALVLFSGVARR